MYSETLYHGTKRSRGEEILHSQRMFITRGKKHWLGDGSYFFIEDLYSYKWIMDMFKDRHKEEILNYENLINHYLIIKSQIVTQKVRIFDLTKAEHKILFDQVHKLMIEKKKVPNDQIAEGVVLNYMFNELSFAEDFDIVRAVFCLNKSSYNKIKSRIGYMPQEQVCIKNLDIVDNILEHDFKERVEMFSALLSDYYFGVNIS
ncbi:hypothetical protein [Paenisporosarcina sp. TG20]|uniref:hypothetical protein n=1 Tax=Paenisporosarcina sp. TG20 TaxID=1211706 RepID=UPI0002E18ECF|nr:hypothetical protein [Paenisporosarcina sp. TG20]